MCPADVALVNDVAKIGNFSSACGGPDCTEQGLDDKDLSDLVGLMVCLLKGKASLPAADQASPVLALQQFSFHRNVLLQEATSRARLTKAAVFHHPTHALSTYYLLLTTDY